MTSKLTRKKKKYHPPNEESKQQHTMDDTNAQKNIKSNNKENNIFTRAIASAQKHSIELKAGRANNAAGNCSYESVMNNINDRTCFKEKLPMSPDFYRRIWTNDMMNRTLSNKTSSWNPGLTERQIIVGFKEMMESGVYEVEFFGDMMMPGIACRVRKWILIFHTNEDIARTGHDPISVVDPTHYGGQVDDDIPVVVAYNLVHYESLHPIHKDDIEETIKLTKAYIAKPSKYEEVYCFTRNDMEYLISSSNFKPLTEKLVDNNPEKKQEDPEKKDNLTDQHKPDSMNKPVKFLFVNGNVKFEEMEEGKIQCGGCKESFSRILGHLTKNSDCASTIDLNEFKSQWIKFTQRKRTAKCYQKQKAENEERFLKEKATKQKILDQKKKAENKEKFLKEKATRQKIHDQTKRAENEEIFLKTQAKKRKKCDEKQKAKNEEGFLRDHAKRQKKCDEKQKAKNEEGFLKDQAKRKKKCDQKQKAANEEEFLKEQAKRRKKCDQKQKAQRERRHKCDEKLKQGVDAAKFNMHCLEKA